VVHCQRQNKRILRIWVEVSTAKANAIGR
jgi:hypothetical protein